ncbi:response regulator [Bradyrhizobium sp. TZ2]
MARGCLRLWPIVLNQDVFSPLHRDARPANSDTEQFLPDEEKVETILVVEDDADLRAYVSDVLRDLNYRIVSAASAQAALTLILQEEPKVDLLLTDVVMPGINGRELGRRAQQIRPRLRILYMTGYSRNAVVHQGRLDGGSSCERSLFLRPNSLCVCEKYWTGRAQGDQQPTSKAPAISAPQCLSRPNRKPVWPERARGRDARIDADVPNSQNSGYGRGEVDLGRIARMGRTVVSDFLAGVARWAP